MKEHRQKGRGSRRTELWGTPTFKGQRKRRNPQMRQNEPPRRQEENKLSSKCGILETRIRKCFQKFSDQHFRSF